MFLQTMPSQFIEQSETLIGTGLEQFYWKPPRSIIKNLKNPKNAEEAEIIRKAFPPEWLSQLEKNGKVLLPGDSVVHVKHRSVEFEAFGESFIEPLLADIAYKRALQQLDFVTIESLINRIVIIKVGSDNENSAYHNLETAQERVKVMNRLYDDTGPNMHIIWAGPDIEVVEVSAHESILDIDGRHEISHERMRMGMGIPQALLDGTEATGQIWAGYEGYRETLRGMGNAWAQAWTALGERVAANNGYEDVELEYIPNAGMLADQSAAADLAIKRRKEGLSSLRTTINATGGVFEVERRNRIIEKGLDPDGPEEALPTDEEIFSTPFGQPGETRTDPNSPFAQDPDPSAEGRPKDSEVVKTKRERPRENRNPRDGK
jgi:hypothetical protein